MADHGTAATFLGTPVAPKGDFPFATPPVANYNYSGTNAFSGTGVLYVFATQPRSDGPFTTPAPPNFDHSDVDGVTGTGILLLGIVSGQGDFPFVTPPAAVYFFDQGVAGLPYELTDGRIVWRR